uniref:Secreted protein n=1 Tax=Macrostomum lignano TaxID=282301 RepID=A0A1I8HBB2_9PLAT
MRHRSDHLLCLFCWFNKVRRLWCLQQKSDRRLRCVQRLERLQLNWAIQHQLLLSKLCESAGNCWRRNQWIRD